MDHNYYNDREQTIALTSDSRTKGERTDEFSNHLIKEVQFSGDWEVALDSLVYTKGPATNWAEHANHWTVLVESTSVSLQKQFQLSPTLYANTISSHLLQSIATTLQLINAIVATISEIYGKGDHGNLTYAPEGNIIKVTIKKGIRLGISREIAHMLNLFDLQEVKAPNVTGVVWLNSSTDPNKTHTINVPKKNIEAHCHHRVKPLKEIRVCADFVEKQLIGESEEPILRSISPSTKPFRSIIKHSFKKRRYVPLSKNVLHRLKLSIKGNEGQNDIVHSKGYLHAVLHFRPQRSNHLNCAFTKPLLV